MLDDLVNGKEKSRFILVYDTVHHRGDCLLKFITEGFLRRLDGVVAFLFDEDPRIFLKTLNDEPRLLCHDGFTDPLNWNKNECSDSDSLESPFYLKRNLTGILENEESLQQILKSGQPAKLGIVINSLSSLITHQDITVLCQDIFEAMNWKSKACDVVQTVALVHCDLHEDNILSSLEYMASTLIQLQQKTKNQKEDFDGLFSIVHCKKSGKMQKQQECYKVEADLQLRIIPIGSKDKDRQTSSLPSETPDITSDLTFNLRLTEQQKEARSHLQLPYLLSEKIKKSQLNLGNKGQIFYQADEADDLDEEDPDDDLNI